MLQVFGSSICCFVFQWQIIWRDSDLLHQGRGGCIGNKVHGGSVGEISSIPYLVDDQPTSTFASGTKNSMMPMTSPQNIIMHALLHFAPTGLIDITCSGVISLEKIEYFCSCTVKSHTQKHHTFQLNRVVYFLWDWTWVQWEQPNPVFVTWMWLHAQKMKLVN